MAPVALGGPARRRGPSIPEPSPSMQARMRRALERIMTRLDDATSPDDARAQLPVPSRR